MLAKRSGGRFVANSTTSLVFSGGTCLRIIWPGGTSHSSRGTNAPEPTFCKVNQRYIDLGRMTNFNTDDSWESQSYIGMLSEIIWHRHHCTGPAHGETQRISTSGCQLLNHSRMRSIGARVRCDYSHPGKESLKAEPFSIWEWLCRGKSVWVPRPTKKVQAQVNERPWFVHHPCWDINVDYHSAYRRPNRLEIAAPEMDAAADVSSLSTGKERSNVERILRRRFHAHDNIEGLVLDNDINNQGIEQDAFLPWLRSERDYLEIVGRRQNHVRPFEECK